MLLIQNGQLMDPYTGRDEPCDILIGDDGVINRAERGITAPEGAQVLDVRGNTVCPGLVDTHVHLRDPGQTEKETLETGLRAAAAGGYTSVVAMANTRPACDSADLLRDIMARAADIPYAALHQSAAVTKGLSGGELTDFTALKAAGCAGLTDDGVNLTGAGLCRTAMEQAAAQDLLLSFHEEEPSLVPSPGVNFGSAAAQRFGVPGARAEAESCMVARDIALALHTGARVVFQHLSCAQSVALVRAGKKLGARIYGEVTPHHLSLTEQDVLAHGTLARMNPPLRTERDRQALIEGLRDGTLDLIATDHAPHTAEEKARDFAHAPSGIIGLETAFSVCNTYLVKAGHLSRMQLLHKMSRAPSEIYGLTGGAVIPGNVAALAVLDWESEKIYEKYYSKSNNSPYTGMALTGCVTCTVRGTRVIGAAD